MLQNRNCPLLTEITLRNQDLISSIRAFRIACSFIPLRSGAIEPKKPVRGGSAGETLLYEQMLLHRKIPLNRFDLNRKRGAAL